MTYNNSKFYVFDLDGTLLEGGLYGNAQPIESRVAQLRELYNQGNTIVIQTARNKAYEEFTKKQLDQFNIPYHALSVGDKIYGDVYVDDKGINANDFFEWVHEIHF